MDNLNIHSILNIPANGIGNGGDGANVINQGTPSLPQSGHASTGMPPTISMNANTDLQPPIQLQNILSNPFLTDMYKQACRNAAIIAQNLSANGISVEEYSKQYWSGSLLHSRDNTTMNGAGNQDPGLGALTCQTSSFPNAIDSSLPMAGFPTPISASDQSSSSSTPSLTAKPTKKTTSRSRVMKNSKKPLPSNYETQLKSMQDTNLLQQQIKKLTDVNAILRIVKEQATKVYEGRLDEVRASHQILVDEKKQLLVRVDVLQGAVTGLRNAGKEKDTTIHNQRNTITQLTIKNSDLEVKSQDTALKSAQDVALLMKQVEQLQTEVKEKDEELRNCQDQLQTQSSRNMELQTENIRLKTVEGTLTRERDNFKSSYEKEKREAHRLLKELNAAKDEKESLETTIEDLSSAKDLQAENLEAMKIAMDKIQGDFDNTVEQKTALTLKLKELGSMFNSIASIPGLMDGAASDSPTTPSVSSQDRELKRSNNETSSAMVKKTKP